MLYPDKIGSKRLKIKPVCCFFNCVIPIWVVATYVLINAFFSDAFFI